MATSVEYIVYGTYETDGDLIMTKCADSYKHDSIEGRESGILHCLNLP